MTVGCESPPIRRADFISDNPEWSQRHKDVITEGYLLVGMSLDQVRAAWGRPCYLCTGTYWSISQHQWASWEYQTQIIFFDEDEKVSRWGDK